MIWDLCIGYYIIWNRKVFPLAYICMTFIFLSWLQWLELLVLSVIMLTEYHSFITIQSFNIISYKLYISSRCSLSRGSSLLLLFHYHEFYEIYSLPSLAFCIPVIKPTKPLSVTYIFYWSIFANICQGILHIHSRHMWSEIFFFCTLWYYTWQNELRSVFHLLLCRTDGDISLNVWKNSPVKPSRSTVFISRDLKFFFKSYEIGPGM